MNFNSLKEKCNYYRDLTDYKLLPNSYVLVMVDGRGFSKLIKNKFEKPFDDEFIYMMNESAKYVCENVPGCKFAYTQSDEVSFLLTDFETTETGSFFGYRLCKLNSIISSLMTSKFNQLMTIRLAKKTFAISPNDVVKSVLVDEIDEFNQALNSMKLAQFDCKSWCVPCYNDAFAWFLYRQIDCIRNSKSAVAQFCCSHKELENKNTDEQIAMAKERGFDWHTRYSDGKKYGRFIYRKDVDVKNETNDETIVRKKWIIEDAFALNDSETGKEKFDSLGFRIERK